MSWGLKRSLQDGRGLYFLTTDQIKDYILTYFAKDSILLGEVDNTSDKNKPISIATQNALNNRLSKEDPYVIYTGNDKSYINSYVRLGNDTWKVYQDGDTLRLNLNGYIKIGENELVRNYSLTNSVFDLGDRNNIAYYLNTDYRSIQ